MFRRQLVLLLLLVVTERCYSLKCMTTTSIGVPGERDCRETTPACGRVDLKINRSNVSADFVFGTCTRKTTCDTMNCTTYVAKLAAQLQLQQQLNAGVIENCTFACCTTDNCNRKTIITTTRSPIVSTTHTNIIAAKNVTIMAPQKDDASTSAAVTKIASNAVASQKDDVPAPVTMIASNDVATEKDDVPNPAGVTMITSNGSATRKDDVTTPVTANPTEMSTTSGSDSFLQLQSALYFASYCGMLLAWLFAC